VQIRLISPIQKQMRGKRQGVRWNNEAGLSLRDRQQAHKGEGPRQSGSIGKLNFDIDEWKAR
jgi:hypothetical protein